MKQTPTQSMRDFFARPDVVALQQIQKNNPHGSPAHKAAHAKICELAATIGAQAFCRLEDY